MLKENESLIRAGGAVVVLRSREKRPVDISWTSAPRMTLEEARHAFAEIKDPNIGIRLGDPSRLGENFYLYCLDLDIRDEASRGDAERKLKTLVGDPSRLARVRSGSGGASRHYYFVSDKKFGSKKLAHSPEKVKGRDGKEHWAWEIELFGTGKQCVLPPSIHPITRQAYAWEKELDVDNPPFIPSADVERWIGRQVYRPGTDAASANELMAWWRAQPKDNLDRADILATLDRIADNPATYAEYVEDRDGWLKLGMGLHHQFDGSEEGFELWCGISAKSNKFDAEDSWRVWESFGLTHRGTPTTFASLIDWSKTARMDAAYGFDTPYPERPVRPVRESRPRSGLEDEPEAPESPDGGPAPYSKADIQRLEALLDEAMKDWLYEEGVEEARRLNAWRRELDKTEEERIKNTPTNIALIVTHHPELRGVVALNDFSHAIVHRKEFGRLTPAMFPLPVKDPINGDLWTDAHDTNLRLFFSTKPQGKDGGLGLKVAKSEISDAVVAAAGNNRFHPIRDYLEGLRWDGRPRMETLFIRYLGCPNRPYFREVSRQTFLAAVMRVMRPGSKWDSAVILEGMEGKRKSTFIQILAKGWFGELHGDLGDRNKMVEQMLMAWILELPDLSAMGRSGVADTKAFMTTQIDRVRLAYGRNAQDYPRQCIFIGSTNDAAYLASETGNRRFNPVPCTVDAIDTDGLKREIDQCWAEAFATWEALDEKHGGHIPLYLSEAAAADEAFRLQTSRKIESAVDSWLGRLADWVEEPISISEATFEPEEKLSDHKPTVLRTKICTLQVWKTIGDGNRESTDRERRDIALAMAKLPGWERATGDARLRFGKLTNGGFGQQVAYVRKGSKPVEISRGYVWKDEKR